MFRNKLFGFVNLLIGIILVFGLVGCDDGGGSFNPGGGSNPAATVIPSVAINVTSPLKGEVPNLTATGTGNFTIGAVSWNPGHNPFQSSTVYTASVTLIAAANHTFTGISSATINGNTAVRINNTGNAVTLSFTFAPTLAKDITGISILSQPTNLTSYTHGDSLNLSGLFVTINYSDSTSENVAFANFGSLVSASPSNGSQLVRSTHNSQPVVVSVGSFTANTNNLSISRKNINNQWF
ncbi:MAG: hypothetical protein FWD47_01190 [Treponema sp.]|nr:hypothetical protein [Treponema sp.]